MSIDGFVATGPDDEQKWVTWALEEIFDHVLGLFDSVDTILIGRGLAEGYIPFWQETLTRPDDPMYAFAERIVAARKVVFSKTLTASPWENTVIAGGDLAEEVNRLKNQSEKDLIVYGGYTLVSGLIEKGLIDDFYLFVNPVALGQGAPIFNRLETWCRLRLKHSHAFPCGIVLLNYELA